MNKLNVVAIDGPAGSGKSTVAKRVAEKLGYLYIDTGAMYRALTLSALKKKISLDNKKALIKLSEVSDIKLKGKNGSLKVYLDGIDVSEEIRTIEVSSKVKNVASIKEVRSGMVRLQRELGEASKKGSVLEGRDIGTVVFPDAMYKFYLDADFDVRIERRFRELKEKGLNISRTDVKHDLEARDNSDMTREVGPLKKAKDATVVDTTPMSINEVVDLLFKVIKEKK